MGELLTIGGSRATTATKAGVCLLIVLFSFGLFMNVNKTNSIAFPKPAQESMALEPVRFDPRSMVPQTTVEVLGVKRSLLEAFPEVKEEENDTDFMYESPAKLPKALPEIPAEQSVSQARADRHVIHLTAGDSPAPHRAPQKGLLQRKLAINKAGVFTVSYSPEPVSFVDSNDQHLHDEANSTYMLFLDPRPDLDDSDVENASAPVSATHETQLEVATRVKDNPELPPMIISLVIPKHIANGSNPFAPEGVSPTDSLMEITCQVIDISITTSERPHN